MQPPPGYRLKPGCDCVILNRSLYGLKQAGRTWWEGLDKFLGDLGFTRVAQDWGVYVNKAKEAYMVVYVDDVIMAARSMSTLHGIRDALMKKWKWTESGEPSFMLGLKVDRDRRAGTITLSQAAYFDPILKRFGITSGRDVHTPLDPAVKLNKDGKPCSEGTTRYLQLVGCIMWAATTTRPDLAFAISLLSRFCANPTQEAWDAGIRVLRYIKTTRTHGLVLGGHKGRPTLEAWTDADWAGDVDTRRSTTGYIIKFYGSTVSWGTTKQKSVALSTSEAEYMALADTLKDVKWLVSMLAEFGVKALTPIGVFCDNQAAISLSSNPGNHRSSKHIDIRYHFIRDLVLDGLVTVTYVPTAENVADVLTKGLARPAHSTHTATLGVAPPPARQVTVMMAKNATFRRHSCAACDRWGHKAKDCTARNLCCIRCGGHDHIAQGCKMSADGYPRPDKGCLHCGQNGHIKVYCQARLDGTPSVRGPTATAARIESTNAVPAATVTNQAGPAGTTSITININHGGRPAVTGTSSGSVEAGGHEELGSRKGQSLSERIGPKEKKKSLLARMDKRRPGREVREM